MSDGIEMFCVRNEGSAAGVSDGATVSPFGATAAAGVVAGKVVAAPAPPFDLGALLSLNGDDPFPPAAPLLIRRWGVPVGDAPFGR